jgi:hypothetical protein
LRFLLVETDPAAGDALRGLGHDAVSPDALPVPAEATPEILREAARRHQRELVVGDRTLLEAILPGSARRETFGRAVVFLNLPPDQAGPAIDRLFSRHKRLSPGRLYTVTPGRVKVAQLPFGEA